MKIYQIALLTLVFIVSGCASVSSPTVIPTEVLPTVTSTSTFTPIPTDTSTPTLTPSPTQTETGTPTLPPGPAPTPIKVSSNNAVLVPDIGSSAQSMVWSRDGKYLFIGTFDKGLAIYDVVNKKLFPLIGNNASVSSLAISPNGKVLAMGLENDGSIRLLAIDDIYPVYALQTIFPAHQGNVLKLAFSPDGKSVASSGYDGNVIVWDAETGKMTKKFKVDDIPQGLVFSPDGKTLIAGLGTKQEFYIWDTDTWGLLHTFPADQVWDLAISSDGSKMVSSGGGIHEANLWDVTTGKLLFSFKHNIEGMVVAVSYDPNGKLAASGGAGDTVYLWDTSTGYSIWELNVGLNAPWVIAFNPDGSQIATGGSRVIIWNLTKP